MNSMMWVCTVCQSPKKDLSFLLLCSRRTNNVYLFVADAYLPTYYTNTCEQSGKAMSCDEGHVVKIIDVRCFPHNITCAEREKIARLCDGLRSCARLDMRRQMNYYCKKFPMKNVVTSFRCLPGKSQNTRVV